MIMMKNQNLVKNCGRKSHAVKLLKLFNSKPTHPATKVIIIIVIIKKAVCFICFLFLFCFSKNFLTDHTTNAFKKIYWDDVEKNLCDFHGVHG